MFIGTQGVQLNLVYYISPCVQLSKKPQTAVPTSVQQKVMSTLAMYHGQGL